MYHFFTVNYERHVFKLTIFPIYYHLEFVTHHGIKFKIYMEEAHYKIRSNDCFLGIEFTCCISDVSFFEISIHLCL